MKNAIKDTLPKEISMECFNDELESWSDTDLNLYRQLLYKLMADGEFSQAKIVAKHLTDLQSDDVYAWAMQGIALLALSDPKHAELCLLKSIEINDADSWVCYHMSEARLMMGDLEGALDWCRQAITLDPEKPPFYWRLMEIHSSRGDTETAIAVGKKALIKATETPDEVKTRLKLANLYLSMSSFDESSEQLNEALKLGNNNSEIWSTLGRCLSRQNKWQEALRAFLNAAVINPHDFDTLYNIGDAYLGLRDPEKAVKYLKQAVLLKHDFSLAHYDLSLAYLELKQYQEAEASAQAALRDDPQMAFQWSNLGMGSTGNLGLALMNQQRMEEAEACFRRNLILIAPTYFNLGLTLFQTQRFYEALENFRRALELQPDDPEYHDLLGQTYEALGQPAEAEQALRRATELDDNYAIGHYDMGVILARREGREQEALEAFEGALKIDSEMASAYYGIACLHATSKKEEVALTFLKKALQKGFKDIAHIENDSDWNGLRNNPKFIRLLEKYREEK
jgi:tetratricopeptide (TPR) repeat protein